MTRVVDHHACGDPWRPRNERGHEGRVLVEGLLPPETVFAQLVTVVGRIHDEEILGQAVSLHGVEYPTYQGIKAVD